MLGHVFHHRIQSDYNGCLGLFDFFNKFVYHFSLSFNSFLGNCSVNGNTLGFIWSSKNPAPSKRPDHPDRMKDKHL